MFGPIMILWFVVLAVLGAMEIVHAPAGARSREPAGTGCNCSPRIRDCRW